MSAVRPPTDAEVVARSLDAPDAFTLIYDRYIGDLHGHLSARLGTRAADDLAPAVFRRAFRRRRRYDPERASVRQWLYDLARSKEPPAHLPVRPPTREVVLLGRNRLRELIATPRGHGWFGSAVVALTGVVAILAVIVLATHQATPELIAPAAETCATTACVGP